MVKRKKQPTEVHEHLSIRVEKFRARVDTSINYEVRQPRYRHEGMRVYEFLTNLEIEGVCDWPEEREGDEYSITVYGSERHAGEFMTTLKDYHVRDEDGSLIYRKNRGMSVPVYDVPKGIGLLDRQRGTGSWSGCIWVLPRVTSDMLALLPNYSPLYLAIHECKEGRQRRIIGLALQTSHPAFE